MPGLFRGLTRKVVDPPDVRLLRPRDPLSWRVSDLSEFVMWGCRVLDLALGCLDLLLFFFTFVLCDDYSIHIKGLTRRAKLSDI